MLVSTPFRLSGISRSVLVGMLCFLVGFQSFQLSIEWLTQCSTSGHAQPTVQMEEVGIWKKDVKDSVHPTGRKGRKKGKGKCACACVCVSPGFRIMVTL